MSRVAAVQASFNGGAISQRLRARIDQALYGISVADMVGWAPLVEGPAEAMPGMIHVEQALGPCRLLRFEYNTTQGHVIEASDGVWRVYTNDALIESAPDTPLQVVSPYSWEQLQNLTIWQSYDVLYCYHPAVQTRKFVRTGATSFAFEAHEYLNGPFEPRNKDEALTISASGLSGTVDLEASADLFAATDVGRLVQLEAKDFGDTPAWEPGITVTAGALRTSMERVYRAATSGKTGSWQPVHTEGIEWDGSKEGTDINDKPAGGVQWEYLHDKFGIVKITVFTDAQNVTGTVERHLPFSAVANNYSYGGGYYDAGWDVWIPPTGGVSYQYGTWRWRLGAFSDTSGWPQCGCVWAERHAVAKGQTVYASVTGDLEDHATYNEYGEISADMALIVTSDDPNAILWIEPDERLLVGNASGVFALGPDNAAQAFGPKNYRMRRQNHAGSSAVQPVGQDGRTLFIGKSGGKVFQTAYDPGQLNQPAIDLTRYARHMGRRSRRFVRIAPQREPHNHVWACRADGTLACANFLPEEEVLGWADRPLATGMAARDICTITDPNGQFDQVWVAAEFGGNWHVLRMAEWREDGDHDANAAMVDLAHVFDGAATDTFSVPLLAGLAVDVVADGAFHLARTVPGSGELVLPQAAANVVIGLRYPAYIESLPLEAGGDNGPAIAKVARIGRAWCDLLDARGLTFGVPGDLAALEQLADGDEMDSGWAEETGFRFREHAGDHTRRPRLRIERIAPAQATLLAWGGTMETQQK